jgi:hypothetical protein
MPIADCPLPIGRLHLNFDRQLAIGNSNARINLRTPPYHIDSRKSRWHYG